MVSTYDLYRALESDGTLGIQLANCSVDWIGGSTPLPPVMSSYDLKLEGRKPSKGTQVMTMTSDITSLDGNSENKAKGGKLSI